MALARRGYTLIELTAATVLLAVAVGVSTLAMPGAASEQRLRTAAAKIAAAYRIAAAESARSSRPHTLVLHGNRCTIRRPILRDEKWRWSDDTSFKLPDKVSVIAPDEARSLGSKTHAGKPVIIPVASAGGTSRFQLDLQTGAGRATRVIISNAGRSVEFVTITP